MTAQIYRPAKNAMQSGMKSTRKWVLEFSPEKGQSLDPLMGWTSGSDMKKQVRLKFAEREDAIAYAKRHDLDYVVREPQERVNRIKAYADSFAYRG